MVYPKFEYNSIQERCHLDITNFIKNHNIDSNNLDINENIYISPLLNTIGISDLNKIHEAFNIIKNKFNAITNKEIKTFDYVHDIKKYDLITKYQIWIYRTIMFYQMLIISTGVMSNQKLFDLVYSNNKRIFNEQIINELPNYTLGIFGSMKPESDIDVGIQYSGNNTTINGLSYVVSIFEDSFIYFLGIESSLKMDIEPYANMITFPNPDKSNIEQPDVFYLDTFDFNINHFTQMLPYIGASILRNYVIALRDTGNNERVDSQIKDLDITKQIITQFPTFFSSINNKDVEIEMSKPEWQLEAKRYVSDYMSSSYNDSREKYYNLVNSAEQSTKTLRDDVAQISPNDIKELKEIIIPKDFNVDNILKIMKALSMADIYRAESYVCPPTVMHVVKGLQASPESQHKYPTTNPVECIFPKKIASCGIGSYGYLMSILEQIGYMIRFDIVYCSNDIGSQPCTDKKEKYMKRYNNALEMYNEIIEINKKNTSSHIGGKRSSRKRKSNKKRRTLKHKKSKIKKIKK